MNFLSLSRRCFDARNVEFFFSPTTTGFACTNWAHGGVVTESSMRHQIAAAILGKQGTRPRNMKEQQWNKLVNGSLREARRIIRMLKNEGKVKHEVAPAKA